MNKITRTVLESYIACRYKAYLMLTGYEDETEHNDKPLTQTGREQFTAFDHVTPMQDGIRISNNVELMAKYLRNGPPEIIGGLHKSTTTLLQFDGLREASGNSDLGDFHYIPVLQYTEGQVREAQKALLDVYGYILAKLQGRPPEHGVIQRPKGNSSTVPLSRNLKKGERLLRVCPGSFC